MKKNNNILTVSSLIKKLQEILASYGDIPVVILNQEFGGYYPFALDDVVVKELYIWEDFSTKNGAGFKTHAGPYFESENEMESVKQCFGKFVWVKGMGMVFEKEPAPKYFKTFAVCLDG